MILKKYFLAFCLVAIMFFGAFSTTNTVLAQTGTGNPPGTFCLFGICVYPGNVNTDPNQNPFNTNGTTGGITTPTNTTDLSSIQKILISTTYFMNNVLMPLLFGIALLMFLINAVRFFIIESTDEEGRKKAKRLMIYGIAAFVFLVSIWGIVNMFVTGMNLNQEQSLCPDYLNGWCGNKAVGIGSNRPIGPIGPITATGTGAYQTMPSETV